MIDKYTSANAVSDFIALLPLSEQFFKEHRLLQRCGIAIEPYQKYILTLQAILELRLSATPVIQRVAATQTHLALN